MSAKWLPLRPARRLVPCALVVTAACSRATPERMPEVRNAVAAPARDATPRCADARATRVCWDGSGAPVSAGAAPVPRGSASPLGLRCHGAGRERLCADRALDASPFECKGSRCVQALPRFPDDGEWECADSAGAMVCRGGAPPSGVTPGGRAEGFWCGARARGAPGERICVDLSPDLPPPDGRRYTCRFEGTARVCEVVPEAHALGDSCDAAHPCVDGALCISKLCVPRAPVPSCWLDADCGERSCRFGSCVEDGP